MICFGDKNIATKTYMDGPNSHTLFKISFSPNQSQIFTRPRTHTWNGSKLIQEAKL